MGKFEMYRDVAGQWRFRLRAANGETIAASEAYTSRGACEDGIEAVRRVGPNAALVVLDGDADGGTE